MLSGLHQAGVTGEPGASAAAALRGPGSGDLHQAYSRGQPRSGDRPVSTRVRSRTRNTELLQETADLTTVLISKNVVFFALILFFEHFCGPVRSHYLSNDFCFFPLSGLKGNFPCALQRVSQFKSTSPGCAVCVNTVLKSTRSANTASARCVTVL